MSRIRALAKESLVYGVSSIASRFINFLLVPFYTHVLTTGEFGVVNLLFALIAFLTVLYHLGFDSAYLRLAGDADVPGRRRLFSTAVLCQVAVSAVLSLLLVALADPLGKAFVIPDADRGLFGYAAAILALDTLAVVPFAQLRLAHRAVYFSVLRMAGVLINVGANLLFVLGWKMGIEGILLANVAASGITLLLTLPVFLSHLRPAFARGDLRELVRFGLPLVPAGIYGIVNEMAGRLFLGHLSPERVERLYPGRGWNVLELNGIFSAAWKLGVFGLLLVQMYRMAWQPFFLQRSKDPDAGELFGRVLKYLCLFVGYASVPMMLFLDKLVAIPVMGRPLIEPSYWAGLEIVPGVLLAYAFQAWFVHFTLGLYLAKQTGYLMWSNGAGAAVTVAGNFLLVPWLGLWGATWSAVLCYLVIAVMVTRRSQRLFPIALRWGTIGPILGWLALGWAAGFAVQKFPEAFPGWSRFAFLAAFCALPFLFGGIRRGELRAALRRS